MVLSWRNLADEGGGNCFDEAMGVLGREGYEEAAAGLGIVKESKESGVDAGGGEDGRGGEGTVIVEATGDGAGGDGGESAGEDGEEAGIDFEGEMGGEGHFAGMAEEAEAGYIGAAVNGEGGHGAGGVAVEREHGGEGGGDVIGVCEAAFEGGGDEAGAEGFGEDEGIAGAGVGIGADAGGVDGAGDGVTELDRVVGDGMAAEEGAASFVQFVGAAGEDGLEDLEVILGGIAEDGEGGEGFATHGIDVGEGVGGGDGAELEGVIDDGGEEVDGLNEGAVGRQLENTRIIGGIKADKNPRMIRTRERGERLRQDPWREFGRSTGGFGVRSESLSHETPC